MIDLKYLFITKFKTDFKFIKKTKKKYQLINSNLDIDKNEKLILKKIDRLIK